MKTIWLTFRATEEMQKEIRRIALADQRSVSNVIKLALQQYLGLDK